MANITVQKTTKMQGQMSEGIIYLISGDPHLVF